MQKEGSQELENIIMVSLANSSFVLSSALEYLEVSDFKNVDYKVIFKALKDYYKEYNQLPSKEELKLEVEEKYKGVGELEEIKGEVETLLDDKDVNEEFAIERIEEFIRLKRIRGSLYEMVEDIKKGRNKGDDSILKVAKELKDGLKISIRRSDIFTMESLDEIKRFREEAVGTVNKSSIVKSCIPRVNEALQFNGYKPGDLVMFCAPPGTGKTSFLINEGAEASKQGFDVLHMFVGDMTHYDGFIRYGACFSGGSQNKIAKYSAERLQKFKEKHNMTGNFDRIDIIAYPASAISVDELIENVEKAQEEREKHYDVIVVDYPDNLKSEDDMMYKSSGEIYNKLSYLAQAFQSVVLVGSQPKLEYYGKEVIPLDGAAESSKKQHIIDVMLTMGKPYEGEPPATIFIPKARRGETGHLIRTKTNWERCQIEQISEDKYNTLKVKYGGN